MYLYIWSDFYSRIVPSSMAAAAKTPQKTAKSTQHLVTLVRLLAVQPQQRRVREVRTMAITATETVKAFLVVLKRPRVSKYTLTILQCYKIIVIR